VYSTCLFCHAGLGSNQVVENFPVGRRLAFDQKRGRLWVVCRRCERWNLSPLDERWEALEECERQFHDARKRVTSENIGLARLTEGLDLVRIGDPLRPEFAAWRYGDQFGRRRRRTWALAGTGLAVTGGLLVATSVTGLLTGIGYGLWTGAESLWGALQRRRVAAVIPTAGGERIMVRGRHLDLVCLHLTPDTEEWGVHIPHDAGVHLFQGTQARRALALIMPCFNAAGASQRKVNAAVREIEAQGDAERYLNEVAAAMSPGTDRKNDHGLLKGLVVETRLAIEMALNEATERLALEGELARLEMEWEAAEEIAAIADTLGLPEDVERQLDSLRDRAG
jgi:hypothetical protein